MAYDAADDARRGEGGTDVRMVARAVALPATRAPSWAVVLDLPISAVVERRLQDETGIQLGTIGALLTDDTPGVAARGTALDTRPVPDYGEGLVNQVLRRWVVLVQHTDWVSGKTGELNVQLSLHLVDIYRRIAFGSGLGSAFSGVLLAALVVVFVLFLLIQGVALVLGVTLARQITGAVHDLFTGTEHLRNRDFTHVIPVRARDQLGELADSFNVMTGEITRLLSDVARKERLEQEFATAREIQMKLLPQGPLAVPGLAVSAYCEPAREVGGDYYDVFPVDEDVFGFLIADVSGKGVGAGLYMAQLKGLVLSLTRQHRSPRDLLIAVNRVLVDRLDGRSFITMSYVVVDLRKQVMTYARAGHCPMIVAPGTRAGVRPPIKVLAPDGLVVGLTLDDGTLFESLLEEVTVPLAPGDLFMLFTDGMSEMMNPAHDCFGETRLGEIAGDHRDLPLDELADRLVAEVRAFGAGADQHDDMTMLLLRVEPAGHAAAAPVAALSGGGGGVMAEVEIVFRTQSEIEASVVEGLLVSQGLRAVRLSGPPPTVFAFAVTPLGEILIGVPEAEAADARRVLLSHGDAGGAGLVVPPGDGAAQRGGPAALRVPRPRPARTRAHAQVAHRGRPEWRRRRQRVARVPRRRGPRLRGGRPALSRVPGLLGRAEVESQGGAGLHGDARRDQPRARSRRRPAAWPRRSEDGRPLEAGAARRRARGGDCRHLSGRRHRRGARLHRTGLAPADR